MLVVDGWMSVVVVDGRKPFQRHLGGLPGGQTVLDTLEAHSNPRVHCPSHTLLWVVVHPACHT